MWCLGYLLVLLLVPSSKAFPRKSDRSNVNISSPEPANNQNNEATRQDEIGRQSSVNIVPTFRPPNVIVEANGAVRVLNNAKMNEDKIVESIQALVPQLLPEISTLPNILKTSTRVKKKKKPSKVVYEDAVDELPNPNFFRRPSMGNSHFDAVEYNSFQVPSYSSDYGYYPFLATQRPNQVKFATTRKTLVDISGIRSILSALQSLVSSTDSSTVAKTTLQPLTTKIRRQRPNKNKVKSINSSKLDSGHTTFILYSSAGKQGSNPKETLGSILSFLAQKAQEQQNQSNQDIGIDSYVKTLQYPNGGNIGQEITDNPLQMLLQQFTINPILQTPPQTLERRTSSNLEQDYLYDYIFPGEDEYYEGSDETVTSSLERQASSTTTTATTTTTTPVPTTLPPLVPMSTTPFSIGKYIRDSASPAIRFGLVSIAVGTIPFWLPFFAGRKRRSQNSAFDSYETIIKDIDARTEFFTNILKTIKEKEKSF
ncbi:uncharacterized protein LOC136029022 isoform X1 [Artemia franciscana]